MFTVKEMILIKNLSTFDIMIFLIKNNLIYFSLIHHLHKIITINFSNKMTNKKNTINV